MKTTIIDIHKMTVIGNITAMQKIAGIEISRVNELLLKSYDELHEMQNELIPKYNQSIKLK